MSIRIAQRKLLWGRANDQCAFPDCTQALTRNLDDPESLVLGSAGVPIGEEAHIRSGQVGGPRYDASYPSHQIDTYANLIALCPTHHTIIDKDNGRGYSTDDVVDMRSNHEASMRASESSGAAARRALSERSATSVQVWEDKLLVQDWEHMTASLNCPTPLLPDVFHSAIREGNQWLLSKDWPTDFPALREAMDRFREALQAITAHVLATFERRDDGWELERKYKKIGWDPELYAKLGAEYALHSMVTWTLTIELTRAANLVVRAVREEIDIFYRFDEGVVLARDGDGLFVNTIRRLEYKNHQWGEPLPAIDINVWRQMILAEAQHRRVRTDDIDAYEMLSLIDKRAAPGANAG